MKTIFYPLLIMKALNNYLNLITLAALCLSVYICSGCVKAATPAVHNATFLPGECLRSPALKYEGVHFYQTTAYEKEQFKYFSLAFSCDLDYVHETTAYQGHNYESEFRNIPPDTVFSRFGDNSETIRNNYLEVCDNNHALITRWHPVVTIFYDSGITLVANKDFAGFKAGENIVENAIDWRAYCQLSSDSEIRSVSSYIMPLGSVPKIPTNEVLNYNYCLSPELCIRILENGFEEVDENVTFTLSIPVKVGLYLTWLNDKISDPDAPFPYREETLTCTFTIHKGLH